MIEPNEPTELIYGPQSSWAPAVLSAGLAGLVVGLFTWFPYAVIGGVAALLALRRWLRDAATELAHLPRKQRLSSAALPLRRQTPARNP